jgi:hypothetical protein
MTTSIHQTITTQTLNDLEEALRLLEGIHHPSATWTEEIEIFLSRRVTSPLKMTALAKHGLLHGE